MANKQRLPGRIKDATNRLGLEVALRRIKRSSRRRRIIYYLHIGKTAGSQVKQAILQVNAAEPGLHIQALDHDLGLKDLPEGEDYFFSIRDPEKRFRSGFYSRKRRGRPLNDIPWTPGEERAFTSFEHANDLAEALFEEGDRGTEALAAMTAIRHTAQNQIEWFSLVGDIFHTRPPIWVLRQEHLEEDLETFFERAGVDTRPVLRTDRVGAHANDYSQVPPLSDLARANLRRWYARDYAFYDAVER